MEGTTTPMSDEGHQETTNLASRRYRRRTNQTSSDERWKEITRSAADVFRRMGYADATLNDVAQEVGINRASLYYYVSRKEDLLIALIDGPLRQQSRDLLAISRRDEPPLEKIRLAIRHHMESLEKYYPELFLFIAEHIYMRNLDIWDEEIRSYIRIWNRMIREAVGAGLIRDDIEVTTIRTSILGLCDSTHRWWTPGMTPSLVDLADVYTTMLFDGLRPLNRSK